MKTKVIAAVLSVLLAGSAQAALITNGNFESGLTGWTTTGNVAAATFNGNYFGGGSNALNGSTMAAFNAGDSAANGTLSQTFATLAGATYAVKFDFGTNSGNQSIVWGAYDGNVTLASKLITDTNPSGLLDSYTFLFTATSASTTLRFADVASNNTVSKDGLIDNVSVKLPEPASLTLLGLGLLGLGVSRRRKAA